MIWFYAAACILIAGLSAYGQWERHEASAAKAERDAARTQVTALGSQIATQNAAVTALKVDGDRMVKAAKDGLAKAITASQANADEAARLRGLLKAASAQRGPAKGCAPSGADTGVAKLREGLK